MAIIERFLGAATDNPNTLAVDHGPESITYVDFSLQVRRLAASLLSIGGAVRVALLLPKGPDVYAAMLATIMVGGTYCPIDTNLPPSKIAGISSLFKPSMILTDPRHVAKLQDMNLDAEIYVIGDLLTTDVLEAPVQRSPQQPIYTIFTSGSTGEPKGVSIGEEGLVNLLDWANSALKVGVGDRWAQNASVGFDLSVIDIYASLCSGATLVPITRQTELARPRASASKHAISIWCSVPSAMDLLSADPKVIEGGVMPRLALFCGEPLLARHVDALKEIWPNCRVVNSYGPTEATVLCSAVEVETNSLDGVTQDSVSIGEPIPGMSFIFRPIEDSDELELGIRGNQVAVGFLVADGQPAPRTDMSDGQRVWWSGDAVHRSGGHLFFSRRIDRQSKVRGYRIELAELDRAVMAAGFPVSYALVFDGELVTFVEGLDSKQATRLRDDLSKHLPAWLVPSSVIPVASVPRTFNGKVDTSALSSVYAASKKSRRTQI